MNKEPIIKDLAEWIESLKGWAADDEAISISWFGETTNRPFSIIGGWSEGGWDETMTEVCLSKVDPCYAMCVKVAINEGPYAYTDFDIMNMPYDEETGTVDDTCIALNWDDDAESLAEWLFEQWERIMREHGEEI